MENRTLTIEKTFNAPLKLVWEAWTQSNHILKWWAPQGMDINVIEHDFRISGKWMYSMPMPNGNEFVSEGTYQDIIEFKKIVTSADFKPMTEGVEIHVSFEEDGNQTKFKFSVIHPTEEYCKQQEEMGFYNGWGSTLDRFEGIIKELSK